MGTPQRLTWAEFGSIEWQEGVTLRRAVLRWPLGLDFSVAELERESDQSMLVVDGGRAGVLMLAWNGRIAKMRQVAVAVAEQGKGLGAQMVRAAERLAQERGMALMVLHARDSAVEFYLRAGYHVAGPPFEEVGIPHRFMFKAMTTSNDIGSGSVE